MSEASNNTGTPGIAERLSVLRTPRTRTMTREVKPRQRMKTELLIGIVVLLAGITMAFFLRGGSNKPTAGQVPVASEIIAPSNEAGLLAGEAFIAIAVEQGNFPPSLTSGDTVRVVVTPGNDGTGSVRSLKEVTVVQSVEPPSDIGTQYVITVRSSESLASAVAASGPIHLSIIKGVVQ